MSYFEFPHTRTYDSDLGWIIRQIKQITEELANYVAFNNVKFADPIEWTITSQYERNTIVKHDGSAYVSKQAVPAGVSIGNEDYWMELSDYSADMEDIRQELEKLNAMLGTDMVEARQLKTSTFSAPYEQDHNQYGRMWVYTKDRDLLGDGVHLFTQGGCIANGNAILVLGTHDDPNDHIIGEFSLSNLALIRKTGVLTYAGHGNDITFNPNNQMLYMTDSAGKVLEIDYTTLSLSNSYDLEEAITNIAYSEKYNVFWGCRGHYIYEYSTEFQLLRTIDCGFRRNVILGMDGYNGQGAAAFDDKFVMFANSVFGNRYMYDVILTVDMVTEKYNNRIVYPTEIPSLEMQAGDFKNGILYTFHTGAAAVVYMWDYNRDVKIENLYSPDVLQPVTGTYNINNFRRRGKLYNYNEGAFTSIPSGLSGSMMVENVPALNDAFKQVLLTADNREFSRIQPMSGSATQWLEEARAGTDGTLYFAGYKMTFARIDVDMGSLTFNAAGAAIYNTDISTAGATEYYVFVTNRAYAYSMAAQAVNNVIQLRFKDVGGATRTESNIVWVLLIQK